jgi:hypothetical protein
MTETETKEMKQHAYINKLSTEELKAAFNTLEETKRINIVLKWHGYFLIIQPLLNSLLTEEKGRTYLKGELIKEMQA